MRSKQVRHSCNLTPDKSTDFEKQCCKIDKLFFLWQFRSFFFVYLSSHYVLVKAIRLVTNIFAKHMGKEICGYAASFTEELGSTFEKLGNWKMTQVGWELSYDFFTRCIGPNMMQH